MRVGGRAPDECGIRDGWMDDTLCHSVARMRNGQPIIIGR